jgi:uncharacterized membrane protein
MRRSLWLVPLLLLAGCQTYSRAPYAPVENVRYTALGQNPFWMVTIGDDSIVLTFGPDPGGRPGPLNSHAYPRTLPRTVDGVTSWTSSDGTASIGVEAMAGPCEGSNGARFRDRVRVRLNGRELEGCGGPRLEQGRG